MVFGTGAQQDGLYPGPKIWCYAPDSHLTRHHPELCEKAVVGAGSKPTHPGVNTLFQAKLPPCSARAKSITNGIAVYMCKGIRPYSEVEKEGFCFLMNILEPRFDIPSRKYFAEKMIPALYDQTSAKVESALESAERVGLTCDGWTSRATESYITVTVHFINEDWEIKSYVLQTRAMHETHTGTHIADVLKAAVGEWNLDAKKPVVVTDNASNMRVAMDVTGYQHVRGFAHVLNLASQCVLKIAAVTKVLVKVRRISTFFHRSTTGAEALKRNQELHGLPLHKLITDMPVRWNSAYEMICRFLEQQPAVCAALLSPEVRKNVTDCALTENDISSAEEMVEAFRPMFVATNIMCEEKNPTISVVAPLHAQLLRDTTSTEEDSPLVREIKGAINQDLSKRYQSEVEKDLLRMSSALDPRFKSLLFLSPEEVQDTYAKLQSKAAALKEDDPVPCGDVQGDLEEEETCTAKKRKSALVDLLGQTCKKTSYVSTSATSIAEKEIKQYQDAPSLPLPEDPLLWWKSQQHVFPLLSKLAHMHLCIPGTSVAAERVFSTAGDIISAQRSSLTPEHADQLLFLKKNMNI
uniref:HAT C-terminal dimerisation domain-containing protein n=1 Tax=Cyprinus carpio TaxID=7962 RepID=A0A8C2FJ66_CYPCA